MEVKMRGLVNFLFVDGIIKSDLMKELEATTYLESMFKENKNIKVKKKGVKKNGKYQRK